MFSARASDSNLQLKGLVEFCSPAVVFGLCGELALLVGQEWTHHGDLDERPEHPGCLPLHIVHGDDCDDKAQKFKENNQR